MQTARARRVSSILDTPRDKFIGKSFVLGVLAANPANPSFRAVYRTGRLWKQLCHSARPRFELECMNQKCTGRPKSTHPHDDIILISGLSILKGKDMLIKANPGFGEATTLRQDLEELCKTLEQQLVPPQLPQG